MATRKDNLTAAADGIALAIANLDAVPAADRVKATYTGPNGQQFGWNEYRASLVAALRALTDAPAGSSSPEQQAGGPWTVYG